MRTYTQASAFTGVIVLATLFSGCGDGKTPNPIAPAMGQTPSNPSPAPTPQAAGVLYTLSGVVFEVTPAGNTPVAGVEVYCEPCGPPLGHSGRLTDARGRYSFDGEEGGVAAGRFDVLLAKQGYVLPNQPDESGPSGLGWMGSVTVVVAGDTRFDIQIIRK